MATVKANTTLVIQPKSGATYDLTFGGITQYGRTSGDTIGVFPVDKEYTLVKHGEVEVYALDQFGVKSYEASELPDPATLSPGATVVVDGAVLIASQDGLGFSMPKTGFFKNSYLFNNDYAVSREQTPKAPLIAWSAGAVATQSGGTHTKIGLPSTLVNGVKVAPAGAITNFTVNLTTPVDLSGYDRLYCVVIPRKVESGYTNNINVFFCSDTGGVNRWQTTINLTGLATGVPHIVSLDLKTGARSSVVGSMQDGSTGVGGTIDWTNISQVIVKTGSSSAADVENYFYISDFFIDAPKEPGFMIGFDKQFRTQYKYALALLRKYNIRATFYIHTGQIASNSDPADTQLTLDEIKYISSLGHKIALHSYVNNFDLTNTTLWPDAASIVATINQFRQWAEDNNVDIIDDHMCQAIINPYEGVTPSRGDILTAGLTSAGIKTIRMSSMGFTGFRLAQDMDELTTRGIKLIETFPLVAASSSTDVSNFLLKSSATQGIASIYTHTVKPVAADSNGTNIAGLEATLVAASDLIAKGRMRNITPDEL